MDTDNIIGFKIFEKNLEEAKAELKKFQSDMNIDTTLTEILKSIDATEVDTKNNKIFKFLQKDIKNLEELLEDSDFITELESVRMKPSDITNTEDLSTFARMPIKFLWLYPDDSSFIENYPIYLLLQTGSITESDTDTDTDDDLSIYRYSGIKMYYVNKEIDEFYTTLTKVIVDIKQVNGDKKWIYTTSNSGEDWELYNKKDATNTFRYNLDWSDIIKLSDRTDVELVFH